MNAPGSPPAHLLFLERALAGDRQGAFSFVETLAGDGARLQDIYMQVFQPALYEVGRLWQENRITVAHEHLVTAMVQTAMSRLYERLFRPGAASGPRLLAACAETERHEVGLRMIADLLELDGWDTHFLGAAVPVTSLGAVVGELEPDVVALSASLPSHLPQLADMVNSARAARSDVVIALGGRPFARDPGLAYALGADVTATDGADLVAALSEHISRNGPGPGAGAIGGPP